MPVVGMGMKIDSNPAASYRYEKYRENMPTLKQFTVSERRARTLLAAWNSANALRLQEAIDQASECQAVSRSSDEAERIEMIQEIAATVQLWMEGGRSRTDLDASIELLRHLAGSLERVSSASARFEMLACAAN